MTVEPALLAKETAAAAPKPGRTSRLGRDAGIIFGAAVLLLMTLIGICAPLLGTKNPSEINPAFPSR